MALEAELAGLIENSGAQSRNHQANERTNSAFFRESLGLFAIGISIVGLVTYVADHQKYILYISIGIFFCIWSAVETVWSCYRYLYIRKLLLRDLFLPEYWFIIIRTAVFTIVASIFVIGIFV